DEFNGRNEDLIETYDIIYIGSNMNQYKKNADGTYPKDSSGKWQTSSLYYLEDGVETQPVRPTPAPNSSAPGVYPSGVSGAHVSGKLPAYYKEGSTGNSKQFNENMYGNVYFTLGDYVLVTENRLKNHLNSNVDGGRYSSRDITADKMNKLKEYLNNDNLILCAQDLMSTVTPDNTGVGKYRKVNPSAYPGNGTKKDRGRVDNSTNMYELLQYGVGWRYDYENGVYTREDEAGSPLIEKPNLVSVGDIKYGIVDKADVEKYIMKSKVELTLTKMPTQYSYDTNANNTINNSTIRYMEEGDNGERELEFGLIISSDIANTSGGSLFIPHLYIDINNDGKFSKDTEDIQDAVITVKATGQEAPRWSKDPTYYALSKDVEYKITRTVDDDYSGYLSWKIAVDHETVKNAHASQQGYTVVRNSTGKDEAVKILQINNSNSTLNLQTQNNNATSVYGKYMNNVDGYKVYVRTVTIPTFIADFASKYDTAHASDSSLTPEKYAVETYFKQYQIKAPTVAGGNDGVEGASMLVLGFGDNFTDFNDYGDQTAAGKAVKAIKAYIEAGSPVLMAHDFIMFNSAFVNVKQLREDVGMDKYGVTQNIVNNSGKYSLVSKVDYPTTGYNYLYNNTIYTRSANPDVFKAVEGTGKAVAYEPGSERNTISRHKTGFTSMIINRYANTSFHKLINSDGWTFGGGANNNDFFNVDKLNDGQITNFPYRLPSTFRVANTHNQYFTLDMETDKDGDGETDTVVWYTLGENKKNSTPNIYRHDKSYKNAQDNFFIYNRGNITYTGAGHSSLTDANASEYEAQLFINTLFAAYKSKYVSPTAGIYDSPAVDAKKVNSLPIPYDGNVTRLPGATDSSILKDDTGNYKYKFVDPNLDTSQIAAGNATQMYLRVQDNNFVRGYKNMNVRIYLKTGGMNPARDGSGNLIAGQTYRVSDGSDRAYKIINADEEGTADAVVDVTDIIQLYETYNGATTTAVARTNGRYEGLSSGMTYGFYLPMSYLNNNAYYTLIFEVESEIHSVSAITGEETVETVEKLGYEPLTVTKTSLLRLN
ncbi:MAG: DUF5057 domain-containing protein, partial [Lachnospiraceae bacterium]|nr:DUF5057 domain-containing protein [Lachnospiraceae bacterium]